MDKEKNNELAELINVVTSRSLANTPEEAKLVDNFILKYRGHALPDQDCKKLIEAIQKQCTI